MRVVPLSSDDAEAIIEIEKTVFPEEPAPSPESVAAVLQNPLATLLGIRDPLSQELLAYIEFRIYAGECELERLAVRPERRREGLGRRLLKEMIEMAKKNRVFDVHLELRASNEAAYRLYQAFGFKEISRRKGYYRDGEDAIQLHLHLNPIEPV